MNKLSNEMISLITSDNIDEINPNNISYKTDNITLNMKFPSVINNSELKLIFDILNNVEKRQQNYNEKINKKLNMDFSVNMNLNVSVNIPNIDEIIKQIEKENEIKESNLKQIEEHEKTKYLLI